MDEIAIGPSFPESPLPPQPAGEPMAFEELNLDEAAAPEPEPEPMLVGREHEDNPPQERVIIRRFRVRRSERIRTRRFLTAWQAAKKLKQ